MHLHLVAWTTYVKSPKSEDYIEELNASFNSPIEAYQWLAPRLDEYAKNNSLNKDNV